MLAGCERQVGDLEPRARYIGSAGCQECHSEIHRDWKGSLHAWAMKAAVPGTGRAVIDGQVRRFSGSGLMRPLQGPDGLWLEVQGVRSGFTRVRLDYFFGRGSIEQHLTPFPGGRLQALPFGFDVRRGEWFDLFDGENRSPASWGHWTNRGMTANSQCLECHTTGFDKGYLADRDEYQTRWAELGVGCEACHGPGREHAASRLGTGTGGDAYAAARSSAQLMTTCAPCHSRRAPITADFVPGEEFLDYFDPELLDTESYYADGQIREEDYEWISFQQSKMFREGVRCWDCHEPHGDRLRAADNALCLRCHESRLAAEEHTQHPPRSAGSRCVSCHMPETVYMGRDPRRDHSFSLPDPLMTMELGIPNACDRCHADAGTAWAADRIVERFGDSEKRRMRRAGARAIERGRRRDAAAIPALLELLASGGDAVRRASAATLLGPLEPHPEVARALLRAAGDADPLVRSAAVRGLGDVLAREEMPPVRAALYEALSDPVRLVRLRAAWALRKTPAASLPNGERGALDRATAEWRQALAVIADTPQAHYNLGVFLGDRGQLVEAVEAYRRAILLEPAALAARYNLALLLTKLGRHTDAEDELRSIRTQVPNWPEASFALGLLHAQQERWTLAIEALEECVALAPDHPRAKLNLGLAYAKVQDLPRALATLESAAELPDSRDDAARTLASIYSQMGDLEKARRWATGSE
jgi:predicted CXXCH cytochrome family protein